MGALVQRKIDRGCGTAHLVAPADSLPSLQLHRRWRALLLGLLLAGRPTDAESMMFVAKAALLRRQRTLPIILPSNHKKQETGYFRKNARTLARMAAELVVTKALPVMR